MGSHFIWYAEICLSSMAKKVKHNGQTLLKFSSTEAENKTKKNMPNWPESQSLSHKVQNLLFYIPKRNPER